MNRRNFLASIVAAAVGGKLTKRLDWKLTLRNFLNGVEKPAYSYQIPAGWKIVSNYHKLDKTVVQGLPRCLTDRLLFLDEINDPIAAEVVSNAIGGIAADHFRRFLDVTQ